MCFRAGVLVFTSASNRDIRGTGLACHSGEVRHTAWQVIGIYGMKPTAAIFTITLLLSANWANAGARDALNSFSKDLKGLDGQFNQQVYAPGGKLKERSSGRVAVAAPKQFRWEYVKPYAQLIVADGTAVWVYDPDLSQVSKRAQGAEEANSPLALLLDPVKLERSFVSKEQATQNGVEWLQITPRNADAAFKSARLGFAAGNLAQLEYMDALGQRTVIVFTAWKRNPAFAKGTFEFTVENLSMDNLAMGMWGEKQAIAGATVATGTPEELKVGKFIAGAVYALNHPKVSTVVVKDSTGTTTYVQYNPANPSVPGDYILDAINGTIEPVVGGAIATATASSGVTLKVSYTYAAHDKVDAFTKAAAPERWLRFQGINTIDDSRVIVDLFRAQFDPMTDYGLINEELGSVKLNGTLLADATRLTGSKFFSQRNLGV